MSYDIEFTGSSVDRRDVSQVTTSSSLIRTVTNREPTSGFYGDANTHWYYNPDGNVTNIYWFGNLITSQTTSATVLTVGAYTYYKGALVDPVFGQYEFKIYRTSSSSSSVFITPSTQTSGVLPTGGTAITPTVTTVQDGAGTSAGAAKEFGLVAKDGTTEKAKALYLPPATTTQNSKATVQDSKIITAENTSLTFETTGLGDAEKLGVDSSVVIEDVTEQTENL